MGMRGVLLLLTFMVSCHTAHQSEGIKAADNPIVFMVFKMQVEPDGNTIQLVSKTITTGKVKKQPAAEIHGGNYLSLCFYDGKKLIDSQAIAHPLYKHLEYTDANNAFAFKDTIVAEAQFFIRSQPKADINELRIIENLKDKSPKQLTVLKL